MRLIIAIVLIGLTASAQDISFRRKRPVVASCTTPTGSTLTESFGDASTSCWSGGPSTCDNTWTASGSTAEIAASPSGGADNTVCANSLTLTASASGPYLYRSLSSTAATPVDIYLYFNIASYTLADSASFRLVLLGAYAAHTHRVRVYATRSGSDLKIFAEGGSSYSSLTSAISLNTWYKLQIHAESGASASYIKINDGSALTFTQAAVDAAALSVGENNSVTATYSIGALWID